MYTICIKCIKIADATSVATRFESDDIQFGIKNEEYSLPALTGSAYIKGDVLTLNVVKLHADTPIEANIDIKGIAIKEASLQILASEGIHVHNTFDHPDQVVSKSSTTGGNTSWTLTFEPASVSVLECRDIKKLCMRRSKLGR